MSDECGDGVGVPGVPSECRQCGGTSFTWFGHTRNKSQVVEGRLRSGDVEAVVVLGCDECSETLLVKSLDSVVALLSCRAGKELA